MFLIVDGSSLLNKHYFGQMNAVNSIPAADSVMQTIQKIVCKYGIDHVCVVLDYSRETTFRRQIYADYKGQRSSRPEELKQQFAVFVEMCKQQGIITIEHPVYEADDFAGTLTNQFKGIDNIILLSGDQDYLQLVSSTSTLWLIRTEKQVEELVAKYGEQYKVNNKTFAFTPDIVKAEYGLEPNQIIDWKGLCGDTSDNIPGVKRLGEKAAIPLLQKYNTIENIYFTIDISEPENLKKEWKKELGIGPSKLDLLIQQRDQAMLSKKLATIYTKVPLNVNYDIFQICPA